MKIRNTVIIVFEVLKLYIYTLKCSKISKYRKVKKHIKWQTWNLK